MNRGKVGILVAAALLGVRMASAETYDATTGFVTAETAWSSAATNGFNAAKDAKGNSYWSDGLAPHPDTNYYVKSGFSFYTPKDNKEKPQWQGGKLVLAGTMWPGASWSLYFDDFEVLGNDESASKSFYVAGGPAGLAGNLKVLGTADNPVAFYLNSLWQTTTDYNIASKLIGGASSAIRCDFRYNCSHIAFTGDGSEYLGTIEAGRTIEAKRENAYSNCVDKVDRGFRFAMSNYAGKLKIGAIPWRIEEDATVPELTLAGAKIIFEALSSTTAPACFTVTDSFVLEDVSTIAFESKSGLPLDQAFVWPLLRFPEGASVSEQDFSLDTSALDLPFGYELKLVLRDGANGTRELCVEHVAAVYLLKTGGADKYSPFAQEKNEKDEWYWSDHKTPEAGKVYVATSAKRSSINMKNEETAQTIYEFPGTRLYLEQVGLKAAGSAGQSGGIKVDDLYWNGGASQAWGSQGAADKNLGGGCYFRIFGGRIHMFADYENVFTPYQGQGFKFESEVVGDGEFDLSLYRSTDANMRRSNFVFTQDNTNYVGRITLRAGSETNEVCSKNGSAPNDYSCTTLWVTNDYALGGARDTFAYDALSLRGYSRLVAPRDVTLPAGLNRGIFITGKGDLANGRLAPTNGATLTVNWPITLNGKLRKQGDGRLALGGSAMRFTDGLAETLPEEGKNLVTVEQGDLKVLSADALNGAAITFFANTRLVVPADAKDADLRTYGLRNTKGTFAASRVALAEGVGTLPIVLDAEGSLMPSESEYQIGLVTLPTEAEVRVLWTKVQLAARRPYKGFAATLDVRENTDGTWTLVADITRTGLIMIVR